MKKKKIWSSISKIVVAIMFISSWAVLGVALALKSAKIEIGGGITFIADDVYARVSGSVSGTKTTNTLSDIEFNAGVTEWTTPEAWKNMTLDFGSGDIVFEFTVQNLSSERALGVSVIDSTMGENLQVTKKMNGEPVTSFGGIEVEANDSATFEITLHIVNRNYSVDSDLALEVNLGTPVSVSSLSQISNSATTYKYYKLAENLDLTSLTVSDFTVDSGDDENCAIIPSFKGTIDGNGKTIKMNAVGNGSFAYLFGEIEGVVENLTLEYDSNVASALGYIVSGNLELRNITANGSVSLTSAGGYSPLVQKAQGDCVSFINCTNNVDITASGDNSYGSAFLGNRAKGGATSYDVNKTYPQYSEGSAQGYKSKKILMERKVIYKNCINNGTISMAHPGLYYGNTANLPDMDNLIIENCVNNGQILGTKSAGYIGLNNAGTLGNGDLTGDYSNWHRGQYLTDMNEYARLNTSGSGSVAKMNMTGLTVSKNSNNQVVITNSNSGSYRYQLVIRGMFTKTENGESLSMNAIASYDFSSSTLSGATTLASDGNTGVKCLQVGMITDEANKKLTYNGQTLTYSSLSDPITGSNFALGEIATGLRIATLSDGTQYYVFDTSVTSGTLSLKYSSCPVSVAVYQITESGQQLKAIKPLYNY